MVYDTFGALDQLNTAAPPIFRATLSRNYPKQLTQQLLGSKYTVVT